MGKWFYSSHYFAWPLTRHFIKIPSNENEHREGWIHAFANDIIQSEYKQLQVKYHLRWTVLFSMLVNVVCVCVCVCGGGEYIIWNENFRSLGQMINLLIHSYSISKALYIYIYINMTHTHTHTQSFHSFYCQPEDQIYVFWIVGTFLWVSCST